MNNLAYYIDSQNTANYFNEYEFAGPFRAFHPQKMSLLCRQFFNEINIVKLLSSKQYRLEVRRNRHLDSHLIEQMCFNSVIFQKVSEILGRELVLWRSNLFFSVIGQGIAWHRDEYHTLLSGSFEHISIHLALNQAIEENCVAIIPGSHRISEEDLFFKYKLRKVKNTEKQGYGVPFYQTKAKEEVLEKAVRMCLKPGEFFIFHPSLLHTSDLDPVKRSKFDIARLNLKRGLGTVSCLMGQEPKSEWLRLGLAIRVTIPKVQVLPKAFSETKQFDKKCVAVNWVC